MQDKDKYRELCKMESSIPIFSQDWWLDAVCGTKNWDVALIEKGGQIVASLPYYKNSKYGFDLISMPMLTQTMGSWLRYPEGQKYAKKLSYEKETLLELISLLPMVDLFNQNFHYSFTNWLPFYWNGFKQMTRYTYVIEDLSDLEKIYANIQSKNRTDIQKATKKVKCYSSNDIKKFYELNEMTFTRQNKKIPYTIGFLEKLDTTLIDHRCRKIFFAEDEDGHLHAAIYIVWDENSAYYLMGGGNPKLRNSGATSFLIWEAIKFAATVTKKFDFEGSMIEPVERFFRGFGAVQKPYFLISKMNRKMKIYHHVKECAKIILRD